MEEEALVAVALKEREGEKKRIERGATKQANNEGG